MTKPAKGFTEGTRVHHRGAIHSRGQDPEHPDGGFRGGWGKVLRSVKQGDGSFEYEVLRDRDIAGGKVFGDENRVTWWGSHHIDEALPPVKIDIDAAEGQGRR